MSNTMSVVNLERYNSGFTYEDYILQIKVNKDTNTHDKDKNFNHC